MFELLSEYKETAYILVGIAAISLTFASFVYEFRKRNDQDCHRYYWKGNLLISLSLIFLNINYLIKQPKTLENIIVAISIIILIGGFYLLKKGNKIDDDHLKKTAKLTDISKPVGIVFGILALLCAPFLFFFSILFYMAALAGDSGQSVQSEWFFVVPVLFIVASILLAVAGIRLIRTQKGSKERLFAPYWLWFRISGILFLIIALSRFWYKNIQGVWVALVAVALLLLSKRTMKAKQQIE